MKTIDSEIGVHDNSRIFLLNKLNPYSRIPVSGWITAQVFEEFRICVRNPKVHYYAHKRPLLDPILMPLHPFPILNTNFRDNAKITTAL
jgi:hypothetical protein